MPIVAIARGSYGHGKRVAEKVARMLGYECFSRETILRACDHYTASQIELLRAANNGASMLNRVAYGKEKYLAYVRKALLDCFRRDNVVYHGFAGHFFVRGVSHVLKVRIIADMEQRVVEEMRKKGVSAAQARKSLEKDDEAHRSWVRFVYGVDTADPSLYDLIIPLHSMNTDEAARMICQAAGRPCFRSTAESRNIMQMLYLAAQVQMGLVEDSPFARVGVEDRDIVVTTRGCWNEGRKMMTRVGQIIENERAAAGIKLHLTGR